MDLQLQGKRALVTGGSSGIGEGIALALAQEGASVIVHGREQSKARRVAEAIQALGGTAFVVTGELATDEGADQVIIQALAAVPSIDILVNNAGHFGFQGWATATSKEWAAVYNGNVLSTVRLIQRVSEQMKAHHFGRIIQLASYEATSSSARFPTYAAAKAALVNLTLSLSKELAGTGITVNAVSPGLVKTAVVEAAYRQRAAQQGWGEDWNEIERHIVQEVFPNSVGRLCRVEDVAALVTFLASPKAAYITGVNHRLDGGYVGTL